MVRLSLERWAGSGIQGGGGRRGCRVIRREFWKGEGGEGAYHSGQVPDTFSSHGSIHSGWNLWLQGSTLVSCPFTKSSVQTEQASPASAEVSGDVLGE